MTTENKSCTEEPIEPVYASRKIIETLREAERVYGLYRCRKTYLNSVKELFKDLEEYNKKNYPAINMAKAFRAIKYNLVSEMIPSDKRKKTSPQYWYRRKKHTTYTIKVIDPKNSKFVTTVMHFERSFDIPSLYGNDNQFKFMILVCDDTTFEIFPVVIGVKHLFGEGFFKKIKIPSIIKHAENELICQEKYNSEFWCQTCNGKFYSTKEEMNYDWRIARIGLCETSSNEMFLAHWLYEAMTYNINFNDMIKEFDVEKNIDYYCDVVFSTTMCADISQLISLPNEQILKENTKSKIPTHLEAIQKCKQTLHEELKQKIEKEASRSTFPDSTKSCSVCTFVNPIDNKKCVVCDAQLQKYKLNTTKRCSVCTFVNPINNKKCNVCNAELPTDATKDSLVTVYMPKN